MARPPIPAQPGLQDVSRDEKGRFVKGCSGNKSGKAEGTVSLKRLFIDKLQETIKAEGAFKGKQYSEAVIHKWLEAIIKGEPWALKLALAYVDGMPVQKVAETDGQGNDVDTRTLLNAKLAGLAARLGEDSVPGLTQPDGTS